MASQSHWDTSIGLGDKKMVGRMAELSALQNAFYATLEKRELRMVTVIGEPGIGKSRLLGEFQRWLQMPSHWHAGLFYGRAEAETAGQPFSLIRNLFRSRFGIQDSDSVNVAREKFEHGFTTLAGGREQFSPANTHRIGRLLGFDFSAQGQSGGLIQADQQTRHQIFQNLSDVFTGPDSTNGQNPSSAHGPVLLLLDDLQWSDDDSLDLVTFLAKNHPNAPIMILTSARPSLLERRPDWGQDVDHHVRLDLEPLTPRESEMLVETLMDSAGTVPAAVREMILADAGGHPFYIEEIIKVLLEKKVLLAGPVSWEFDAKRLAQAPISATLRGLLRARLDGLSAPERQAIQCASVVGSIFWESAIESLCQTRPETISKKAVSKILDDLCRKDLVHRRESSAFAGTAEYVIKHDLLRDVVFETLPKKQRSEHHAQAANWFIKHSGDRIREFSGLVAVHMEQAGQSTVAAEWYGRAGQQAWNSYSPGAAIDYFQKAINLFRSLPENGEKSGDLTWHEGLSEALSAAGRFKEALVGYEHVCTIAASANDIAVQARAWNGIAYVHERFAEYRASIDAAEKAALLARRAGDACADELIRSLYLNGWGLYRLSDAEGVLGLAAQLLGLCERLGKRDSMARCYNLFGVANLQLGRYSEAEHYFEKGLALSLELGRRHDAAISFSDLGEIARLKGDYLSAISLYEKALEIAREIGRRSSEIIYLSNLGGARLGLKQFQEAERDLRQVIAITGRAKACALSETYTFLAQACLGQGKPAEALDAAQQAISIATQTENPHELAQGWRVAGQVLVALEHSGQTGKRPLRFGSSEVNCDSDYCFAESIRLFEAMGAADEQARTSQMWAACARSA